MSFCRGVRLEAEGRHINKVNFIFIITISVFLPHIMITVHTLNVFITTLTNARQSMTRVGGGGDVWGKILFP